MHYPDSRLTGKARRVDSTHSRTALCQLLPLKSNAYDAAT
jgi:hypothetical protein